MNKKNNKKNSKNIAVVIGLLIIILVQVLGKTVGLNGFAAIGLDFVAMACFLYYMSDMVKK